MRYANKKRRKKTNKLRDRAREKWKTNVCLMKVDFFEEKINRNRERANEYEHWIRLPSICFTFHFISFIYNANHLSFMYFDFIALYLSMWYANFHSPPFHLPLAVIASDVASVTVFNAVAIITVIAFSLPQFYIQFIPTNACFF